jgi:hypothetical protein
MLITAMLKYEIFSMRKTKKNPWYDRPDLQDGFLLTCVVFHAPCPFHEKKENRQVTWSEVAVGFFCTPNAGTFFTRGHQLLSPFYLVFRRATHPRQRWRPGDRICHQHTSRPPAPSFLQRPAPTEKEIKVSFVVKSDTRTKLETKNPCGKSLHSALRIGRPIQNAVCHDTCKTAAAARPRQHNFKLT